MNLRIEDAVEFADFLVENKLDQYSELRYIAGKKAIEDSERFRHLFTKRVLAQEALLELGI